MTSSEEHQLLEIPAVAAVAAAACRWKPQITRSRSIAFRFFPRLFFRPDVEYRVPLAGCRASVRCRTASLMERSVLCTGFWEQEESEFINQTVKPGWTVIDLGANAGLHTCRLADLVGPQGSVYAFEANPRIILRLKENMRLNSFQNTTVINRAVSCDPGSLTLHVDRESADTYIATLVNDPERVASNSTVPITVESISFDDWWESSGRPDVRFVKADIEGFEWSALKSGKRMLESCRPIILAEYSEYFTTVIGHSWEDIRNWFGSLGYRLSRLDGAPLGAKNWGPRELFDYVAEPELPRK